MFSKEIFSSRLRAARIARALTAKAVADSLGISKAAMSMLESGKNAPSLDTLMALSDLLDCSVDYLLGRSDTPKRR